MFKECKYKLVRIRHILNYALEKILSFQQYIGKLLIECSSEATGCIVCNLNKLKITTYKKY